MDGWIYKANIVKKKLLMIKSLINNNTTLLNTGAMNKMDR